MRNTFLYSKVDEWILVVNRGNSWRSRVGLECGVDNDDDDSGGGGVCRRLTRKRWKKSTKKKWMMIFWKFFGSS